MFDLEDKEGNIMIEKLKQFTQVDIDAIPHVIVSRVDKCLPIKFACYVIWCIYINIAMFCRRRCAYSLCPCLQTSFPFSLSCQPLR